MWSLFKRQEKCSDTSLQSNINSFSTTVGTPSSISRIEEEIRIANTLEALKKRVKLGIGLYAKMGPLRKKFAEDNKSTSIVVRARDHDEKLGSGYEELKRNFETITKRLEVIPILQDQLQAVCTKVAQLSDVVEAWAADGKNVQERINCVTDYTAPSSANTLHSIPSNVARKPLPKPAAVQSSRNLTVFERASGTDDGTASTKAAAAAAAGKKPLKNKSSVATGKVSRVNRKLSLEGGRLPPREEKASGPGAAAAVCVAGTEENTNVQDEHVRVDAEKPYGICDFLQNHPAPEWIELERKSNSTDDQRENVGSPAVTDKKCVVTRSDPVVDERHETITGRPDVTAQITSPEFQLILDRLDHLKKSQDTEKNEVLAVLSRYEKKIQEIDEKIDANNRAQVTSLMGSLDEKASACPEELVRRTRNQSIVKIDNNRCHRGQQVSGEDIAKCLEDRTVASCTRNDRPQPVIVNITFTGDKNNGNAQSTCKSDRCVFVSETKEKSNVQREYARVGAEKSNEDHDDRLKSKSHSERTIQFSHYTKTDEINEDGVKKITKTNSDQKSVSTSTRLKCTNRFSSESVNNDNDPKETQCEEHICDFFHNQPVPEWIRPKQTSSATDNPRVQNQRKSRKTIVSCGKQQTVSCRENTERQP